MFEKSICFICYAISPTLSLPDCASWVQAIGAILALGVAIFIMWRQMRFERKNESLKSQQKVLDVIRVVVHLAGGLKKVSDNLLQCCRNGNAQHSYLQLMLSEITSIDRAIGSVPIWVLDEFQLTENILAIQTLSHSLRVLVEDTERYASQSVSWVGNANNKLSIISPQLDERLKKMIEIEKSRHSKPWKFC